MMFICIILSATDEESLRISDGEGILDQTTSYSSHQKAAEFASDGGFQSISIITGSRPLNRRLQVEEKSATCGFLSEEEGVTIKASPRSVADTVWVT